MIKNTLDNIDLRFKVLGKKELERPNYQNKGKLKKEVDKFGEILPDMLKIEENQQNNDKSALERSGVVNKSFVNEEKTALEKKRSETERKFDLKELEFTKREGSRNKPMGKKNASDLFVNLNNFCIQGDILQHFKQKHFKNNNC